MDKLIPFFYYDILARIIPGAATLATLLMVRDKLPPSWLSFFAVEQNWKAVVVPLLLGGLCYVVGVLYEATDYSPVMKWAVLRDDDNAFDHAWSEVSGSIERNQSFLKGKSRTQLRRFRFQVWDTLVFKGGKERGMGAVFAHSHRFQAEHKMFLHLIYPMLLLAGLSFARCWPIRGFVALTMIPVLFYLSHLRNQRRWIATLSFCKQLGDVIETCARATL